MANLNVNLFAYVKYQGLRTSLETWEERAAACLVAQPKQGLAEVRAGYMDDCVPKLEYPYT